MCSTEERVLIEKLTEIDTSGDELNVKIDLSLLYVNEHCLEQARRVDLAVETRIEQLNELRAKIGEYEATCMRHMDTTKSLLVESVERAKKWSKSIREMERRGNFLVELSRQAEEHLRNLTTLHQQINGFQFSGQLLTFQEEEMGEYKNEDADDDEQADIEYYDDNSSFHDDNDATLYLKPFGHLEI
jgi:hypothetical protein